MTQEHDEQLHRLAEALKFGKADADDPMRSLAEALVPDPDYDHQQVEQELPLYVSDELLGRPTAQLYPALHRHLLRCQRCAELHVALLMDISVEPAQVVAPQPDLSFLPGAYVRRLRTAALRLAQQIGAALSPEALPALADVAELLLDELQELGPNLRTAPSSGVAFAFAGDELPDEIRLLAATWTAARSLGESLSSEEMSQLQQSGAWPKTARTAAVQAAVDLGFDQGEAERFAHEFASLVASDPAAIPARTAP